MANTASAVKEVDNQQHKKSSGKVGSAFRKVGRYLKDQATEQSHSALYLSPPSREPQNAIRYPSQTNHQHFDEKEDDLVKKILVLDGAGYSLGSAPPAYTPTLSPFANGMMDASGTDLFRDVRRHQYASDNILQSYDVLRPQRDGSDSNGEDKDKYWLVYIHGGYFRDPKVDSTSFRPAIILLEEANSHSQPQPRSNSSTTTHSQLSTTATDTIAGYVSLNYRLSPHPAYPQDPQSTPSYTLNNARWPNQPNDILLALQHLHKTYPGSTRYILVGHSVGATLAFIAALQASEHTIAPPCAVLGVSGIYDYPLIHRTNTGYEDITRNAMSPETYEEASPALYPLHEYRKRWIEVEDSRNDKPRKKVVVLAHSRDDGLVSWDQVEEMRKVFNRDGAEDDCRCELVELKGKHNQIWEEGIELVWAITRTVDLLRS
ncbi:Kynurenine formamidase [Lithohypha guttulata]|nr:Kynurenine formamidase [Lithohypha guttulata]